MDRQLDELARKEQERRLKATAVGQTIAEIDAELRGGASLMVGRAARGLKQVGAPAGRVWGPLDDKGSRWGWVEDLDITGAD